MAAKEPTEVYYKTDDYYYMAIQVEKDLPEEVRQAFDVLSSNIATSKVLQGTTFSWVSDEAAKSRHYDKTFSLANLVWYILFIECSKADISDNFLHASKKRINRRRYILTKTEREYKEKKGVLYEAAREYISHKDRAGEKCEYASADAFAKDYKNKVKAWSKSDNPNLVAYPLSGYLSAPKRTEDFMTDLSYHIFRIVKDNYNGNPVMGYVTRVPKQIMDSGIFSGFSRDTEAELDYSVSSERVTAKENRRLEQKDGGMIETSYVAGTVDGVFDVPHDEEEKQGIIADLKNSGSLNVQAMLPDAIDQGIFTYIYSSFTMDDLAKNGKDFRLADLARSMGKRQSQGTYMMLLTHLDRIMRLRVDYTTYTETHHIKEAGSISLFPRIGYRNDGADGENVAGVSFTMQDNNSNASYIDDLSKIDLKNLSVTVEPSTYLRNTMVKALNESIVDQIDVSILTRDYKSIGAEVGSPDRVRNILMLLQEERTAIYPKRELRLDYRFFSQRLHMERLRAARLKKILDEAFSYLKTLGTILSDYTLRDYNMDLTFMPFSQEERELLSGPKRPAL